MDQQAPEKLSLSQRERLGFIEFRLMFLGDLRRPDLMDRFEIGPAVSTRDIAAYRELAPDNIQFNDSLKRYEPTSTFKPIFEHEVHRVLSALSMGFGEGIGKASQGLLLSEIPQKLNLPALSVLSVLSRAIYQKQAVKLTYHSYSSGISKLVVVPFVLFDSGERWYIRAYDRKAIDFKNFAISRISKAEVVEGEVTKLEAADFDVQWQRVVTLELFPHPSHSKPEIVEIDYSMKKGKLALNVRAAIVGYLLQKWQVDSSSDHHLDPSVFKLWLKDSEKVLYGVKNANLAPGYNSE